MTPTKEHAIKIIELLSHGLVKGLGKPKPGEMCIEAVVCFALELPHGDNPPCVGEKVRNFKIRLNDQDWINNQVRAEGMKRLAIAQLGSSEIDQEKFNERLFYHIQLDIIIPSFDLIPLIKILPEHDKEFSRNFGLNDDYHHYYCYYYNYYSYHYYYNYYNYFGQDNFQKMLITSAECGVKALQDLNCRGCQWLDLIPT